MIASEIHNYNQSQIDEYKKICQLLAGLIEAGLPNSTNKLFHSNPAWFIDENPIVGYAVRKKGVMLMFWSGQSFVTAGLSTVGSLKFKAAGKLYMRDDEIDAGSIKKWLAESVNIQYDYKNLIKKKGQLDLLKTMYQIKKDTC